MRAVRFIVASFLFVSIPVHSSAGDGIAGVVAPGFGKLETAGAANAYVDNTSAAATDTNNPLGSPSRPRRTVPTSLAAGTVVEVHGGPYAAGDLRWTAAGTMASPVFVIGVGKPLFVGNGIGDRLRTGGSFLIVDGFQFSGVKIELAGKAMALRNSDVRNTNTTAVVMSTTGGVLYHNAIYRNGDANSATEHDTHGVLILPGATFNWVLENDIHENGGDAVQVGSVSRTEPWAQFVWIAGNQLHQDRENGVDIKVSRDVIVSRNVVYGYIARSSSSGEAIVVHNDPERVWILNNAVGSSQQGIVCTGAVGYVVAGNIIMNIRHAPGSTYTASSLYGTSGILTYNSTQTLHINNTIWNSDAGISIASGGSTQVVNNIVAGLAERTDPIRFGSTSLRQASLVSNNVTSGDPGFADPTKGDFRLPPGSNLIDAGMAHGVYSSFEQTYKVPFNQDFYGGARSAGATVDIGAAEFQPR